MEGYFLKYARKEWCVLSPFRNQVFGRPFRKKVAGVGSAHGLKDKSAGLCPAPHKGFHPLTHYEYFSCVLSPFHNQVFDRPFRKKVAGVGSARGLNPCSHGLNLCAHGLNPLNLPLTLQSKQNKLM